MKPLLYAFGATLLVLGISSCTGAVQFMSEAFELRDTLSELYGAKDVNVEIINGELLKVTLVNSPYNDSSSTARERAAINIGKIARHKIKAFAHIEEGSVEFLRRKDYWVYKSSSSSEYDMHLKE